MLSSPRWTYPDTLLVVALMALLSRLPGGAAEADPYAVMPQVQNPIIHVSSVLAHPLPEASEWMAMNMRYRLDGAMRCIGLAEARRDRACASRQGRQCRRAKAQLADLEASLWPKGREGRIAVALRGQVTQYARAYIRLLDTGVNQSNASSELILSRDDAMCKRYHSFTEARLNGSETRQSG